LVQEAALTLEAAVPTSKENRHRKVSAFFWWSIGDSSLRLSLLVFHTAQLWSAALPGR